jgi:hypothetical protein
LRPARDSEPPPPLHPAAFHGLAGTIVRTIAPDTEADLAALLIQFLAAFGFAVGRCAFFSVDGARHFPNLFVIVAGETAKSRKGTSWSRLRRDIFEQLGTWPRDRVMNGLSSGEGLIEQVKDDGDDKRLLVVQSEFGSVLKVMQRRGNTLSPVLRDAWDGTDLHVMTKRSPASVSGEHIAVIGHITCDEILTLIGKTDLWDGFANRFLWCLARRARELPHGGSLASTALQPFIRQLETVINWARNLDDRRIDWDQSAKREWERIYSQLSAQTPGLLGAITSRGEAQVVRLALIYALLDQSYEISVEHLRAARAVWLYCEASARYIFGNASGDPIADEISRLLADSPAGVTRTEISECFDRHRSRSEIERALAHLESGKLARKETEKTSGRPIERWFAISQAKMDGLQGEGSQRGRPMDLLHSIPSEEM